MKIVCINRRLELYKFGGLLTFLMPQNTPFLPGISHHLFGRQRRCQLDQLRAQAEQWRR